MTFSLATSPALDLSGLPAPAIVEELAFEAILAAMIADLTARWPEFSALVESEPAVKLLQVAAYREAVIRREFNDRARGVLLAFATGTTLDHHAAFFGLTRIEITPANPATGAAAVMESDEDLRRRILLAPDSWCVAGPEAAYVFHALGAHADVADASATSPAPREVVVTVLAHSGTGVPSAPVLAAVEAVVAADGVRPLTDLVTVQAAALVDYAVNAQLTLFAGPDSAAILAAADAALTALAASKRRLGHDVPLSAIVAALHVGGVKKVVLTSPVADVNCSPAQVSRLTARTLTIAGYD